MRPKQVLTNIDRDEACISMNSRPFYGKWKYAHFKSASQFSTRSFHRPALSRPASHKWAITERIKNSEMEHSVVLNVCSPGIQIGTPIQWISSVSITIWRDCHVRKKAAFWFNLLYLFFFFWYRCASCLPLEITWWKKGRYCVKKLNSWGNNGCQGRHPSPWHLSWKLRVTPVPRMKTSVTQPRKKSVTRDA